MTGAQVVFVFVLGAAVDSGMRIVWEWWMGRVEAREGNGRGSKRRKVKQDDYYRHCDGCGLEGR